MSKVLVDRELLEQLQEKLDPHRDAVLWGTVYDVIRRAQPAEADGPSFAEVLEQASVIQQLGAKNKRIDELQASLSAVTAERDRLREHTAKAQQHALDMGNKALAANQLLIEVRGVVYQSYIDRCDPEAAGECLEKIDAVIAAMSAKEA